jgi:hypothetical protein
MTNLEYAAWKACIVPEDVLLYFRQLCYHTRRAQTIRDNIVYLCQKIKSEFVITIYVVDQIRMYSHKEIVYRGEL